MDRERPSLASPIGGRKAFAPMAGDSSGCGPEYGLREGTGRPGTLGATTGADRATRHVETAQGILSYSELAPRLAAGVLRVETEIYGGAFDAHPLDENLPAALHRGICADLVPDWAGHWRKVDVRVGNLQPPPPPRVPLEMRDYGRDLQTRWTDASSSMGNLTLELLAFSEGRFLSIHPFLDFNGRVVRLLMLELLRRLDLPRVTLTPENETDRLAYFSALEAADRADWQPLMRIWAARLSAEETL